MSIVTVIVYVYVTLVGIILGNMMRFKHNNNPVNEWVRIGFALVTISGFLDNITNTFYYFGMMVILGWMICDSILL